MNEGKSLQSRQTEERIAFADVLSGLETDPLPNDSAVKSVFAILRLEFDDGASGWSARSGGEDLSSEELLGALRGLIASLERDLADLWEW